jgi:hypothetical protein
MTPQDRFLVVAPVAAGKEPALRALLHSMNAEPGIADARNGVVPFAQFERLHFARFVILDDRTVGDIAAHGVTPPLAWDYLMLPLDALTESIPMALSHEIGHACGLDHVNDASNLMMQGSVNDGLYDWQIAGVRTSRHCVYI